MRIIGVRLLLALVCATPFATATASAEEAPKTPQARRTPSDDLRAVDPDCDASCDVFRRECLPYCEQNGHVPNSSAASGDCKAGCRAFESQCLEACLRSNERGIPFVFPAPLRR